MKITSISTLDYVGMSATLPLEDGVTTLVGPNAGGKTMLVNVVPGILFNEAKLATGAACGFTWSALSGDGSMMVSKKGAKTTWRGTVNGEAKLHNTIKPAQAWMREHFPIAQPAFITANFLAAFRSSTMLGGSPAARMQLLADIIDLRVFDDLKKGISKLADSANITIAVRDRIKRELQELSDMGAEDNPQVYLGGITGYLAERRSDIKSEAIALADALEDRPFGDVPTVTLNQLLTMAPERNKAWDAWDECSRLNVYDMKKPSAYDYNTALALVAILDLDDRASEVLVGHHDMVGGYNKARDKLTSLKAEITNIDRQLEHLQGHSGNTCPTCGSDVNNKLLRKTLNAARKKLVARQEKQTQRVWVAGVTDSINEVINAQEVKIKDVRVMMAFNYQDIIQSYEAAVALEKRFGGELPSKPEKGRIYVEEINAELRLRRKGYGMLKQDERRYEVLSKRFAGASGVLNAVTELVEEQSEMASAFKRRKALIQELGELPHADDADLLIELLKSLDNRNARNPYLELVSEHLIATLNELAPAFFKYRMEFAWSAGKLIANRKGGATDTVLLSGREGRTFMLLNAVAIQRCLPPGKRLRTLFLDELEAGSSPENRALLAELIPTLLDYYDNICVVTPLAKNEFYIDGPRYRVTEAKGKKALIREE